MRRAARICGLLTLALALPAAAQSVVDALRADAQAATLFAETLAARDAAQTADAYLYAPGPWQRAEDALAHAAAELDRDARDEATVGATAATELFHEAERAAVEAALLAEPRAALGQARKARASRNAPQTLARAEQLVAQAEQALRAQLADRERARALAAEATIEARRATVLAPQLADATSAEQTVIAWQDAVEQIARSAGVELVPATAPAAAATAIVAAIEGEHGARAQLEQDLADRNEQIRGLQGESSALASQLDGVSRERIELARQVEAEAAARERLASLEGMFEPGQAAVLRERDDIVIRLPGVSFAKGSTKLGRDAQRLLDEVVEAIGLYAERDVIVEGHTDGAGGADANLELSRARARSVREYLIASGRVAAARVTSEGYGEARPVASNDSDEGRAGNRRIDVRLRMLGAT